MEAVNGHYLSAEAQQLMQAIDIVHSATADTQLRSQAYVLCEKFKEESPSCASIGFQLALSSNNRLAKHFGLQLIEYCIKFRWSNLQPQDKVTIKNSVWEIMQRGMANIMDEASYIKDGTARLVVEMAKREWPQQWPTFLTELTSLAKGAGCEIQTELVLLVLLRLTEDVVTFQSIESASRRRDLHQALTANMGEIFEFLSHLLQGTVATYQCHTAVQTSGDGNGVQAAQHCRLAKSTLQTLSALVDWIHINHIMAQEGKILEQLCLLLSDEHLHLEAANCLLQCASRKGPLKERKPLLILFSEGAISSMLKAAQLAASQPLAESNHDFLKRLAEVLVALGSQLCSLYGREADVSKPATFAMYLQALLALTRHPSPSLNVTATSLWLALLRHERISTDPDLMAILEPWVNVAAEKLIKVGYPSRNDHAACAYSRLDFESDDEFSPVMQRLRVDLLDALRSATLISPEVTYNCVQNWLQSQLTKPVSGELCTASSPTFLEWEALTAMLDCVVGVVSRTFLKQKDANAAKALPAGGLQLLDRCLVYDSPDPLIASVLLSCISAMFVFVHQDTSRLQPVLRKVLTAMVFTLPGQTKESRSRTVRNVRRHACSLMVKISRQFPTLLLPAFDYLKSSIEELSQTHEAAQLSRMERVTLQEALLLISNQYCNFDFQSTFIGEVMRPCVEQWTSTAVNAALDSSTAFMKFVGLDQSPVVESGCDDAYGQNRSELLFCTNVLLAVVKRCSIPDDAEAAARGGFGAAPAVRHPSTPHLLPLLYNVFRLARVLHGLWEPSARQSLSRGYVKALDMLETEMSNILGQNGSAAAAPNALGDDTSGDSSRVQGPLERMQSFLERLHLNTFSLLGLLGETLTGEFYALNGLPTAVAGTACFCLEYIPDYRLRTVMKIFCRPFIACCPSQWNRIVLQPFLAHLCPAMLQRLTTTWQRQMALHQQMTSRKTDDDDTDNILNHLEVVDDVLSRMLTKDYLDVLKTILFVASSSDPPTPDGLMDQDAINDATESTNSGGHTNGQPGNVVISELGMMALSDAVLSRSIVQCIVSALWWPDTTNSMKATLMLSSIVKHWTTLGRHAESFPNAEWCDFCLTNVLNGLQVLGQHEGNQASLIQLAVQVYDAFRPVYPSLADSLLQHTQCNREDLAAYEEKLFGVNGLPIKPTQKLDRAKRELFRKIASQVTGKHVGQLFRKQVDMAQLPAVKNLKPRLTKSNLIDAGTDVDVGLTLLFAEDD